MSGGRDGPSSEGAFTTEIPVRYSDVDSYGHVNNATYATYLEEARIDYLEAQLEGEDLADSIDDGTGDADADGSHSSRAENTAESAADSADESPADSAADSAAERTPEDTESDEGTLGMVVANLQIDFRRPIEPTDAVTVEVGVGDVGTSSFTIEYVIHSEDGVHAEAESTMVAFDRAARESRPIPDRWRRAIADFEGDIVE